MTKCGGGARLGGGPSIYERWHSTFMEWMGKGMLSMDVGDNSWGVLCVMAGQAQAAEVDAERVRSEGIPGLSIETLDEWERIFYVERIVDNPDARRWILLNLTKRTGDYVSPSDAATACDEFFGIVSDMTIATTAHTCTIAECTTADNAGDGVRYWALLVPEWVWRSEWRGFYYLFRYWCNRVDRTYCEANLPVTHTGGEPRFLVSVTGGPESGAASIVDRDVVRD